MDHARPRRQRAFRCGVFAFLFLTAGSLPAAESGHRPIAVVRPERTDRVSFHREILPVLQANCLPCHNQTRAKAGLILETPETMVKGGDSGTALVPGKPAASPLLQAAAHQSEDSLMPPADNKVNAVNLTPGELGLLWLWIEQGAYAEAAEAAALNWQSIPTNWVSSFAVALTEDGKSVAVARANRVSLYDAKTGRPTGRLLDPKLGGGAQRDLVSALAFSPDGELLAAAGFREVRIWQRQPVASEPAWPAGAGIHWLAATFSPDLSQLATLSTDGQLEVRASKNGRIIRSWPIHAAPRAHLVWTPDGKWIATAGTNQTVYVVSVEGKSEPFARALSAEVTALAWFDQGRQLATVIAGTNTIQTWRLPEGTPTPTQLESTGERTGHAAAITALASEAGGGGGFVSAGADGVVRRWSADPGTAPQEVRVEGAIVRLVPVGTGARFLATLAAGGATLLEFGDAPKVAGKFGGDPRMVDALAVVEHELALSRLELARAGTLITEAEAATKSGDEALAKAREKRDGHAKALAEKEKELTQQRELEVAVTKERDERGAELQRVADAIQAADKALEEARATAKGTAEAEGAALVAAGLADRLKSELERLRAGLPESDSSEAATKTREAAASAGLEAAARTAKGNETRAAAEQAREGLATRAFAAGQRKAEFDRAQAELPPRKKQAEERLAAAQKAIGDLNPQITKARITLDGSMQDFALAEKSIARAAATLAEAKAADEAARKRIAAAEARVQEIQPALAQAATVPPAAAVATPDGGSLITINPDGLAAQWELLSGAATTTFALADQAPLAVASMPDHQFLAVFSNRVVRVDTSRPWMLQRTIGNAEATDPVRPFVDRVNALAFSPDGQLLATGGGEPSRGGELKLWQVINGELIRDLGAVHSDSVMAVAFSPRGEWLATGGADRFARLTPVVGDEPRINLEGHTHHVLGVAWQADGSTLATAGADGVVKLWNPKTGERRKDVEGFGKEVTGLRSVGITNQFVAVSGSGQGRVFRADGEKVRELAATPAFLQAMSATRSGNLVAGAGDDGVLRIWDVANGEQRLSLPPE